MSSSETHPNAESFPRGLSGPALRALSNADIRSLTELSRLRESEVAVLHGMGPKGLRILKDALRAQGGKFRAEK